MTLFLPSDVREVVKYRAEFDKGNNSFFMGYICFLLLPFLFQLLEILFPEGNLRKLWPSLSPKLPVSSTMSQNV